MHSARTINPYETVGSRCTRPVSLTIPLERENVFRLLVSVHAPVCLRPTGKYLGIAVRWGPLVGTLILNKVKAHSPVLV